MPRSNALRRIALALALAGISAASLPALASAQTLMGTVSRSVDGDTIHVRARGFDTTVRLIGIDTPETHRPGSPVQCFGAAASERTARILPPGTAVRLETDSSQDTRDRYGRLLAYVYKTGRAGAAGSVNYALVAAGYAKVYVYGGNPFRYTATFQRAQSRARSGVLGLWGPPCRGDTSQPAAPVQRAAVRPAPGPTPSGSCNPNYTPCVANSAADLDCADVGHAVSVIGSDPYRLDGDGDGSGCESYG
jgi:micrococcal nuclease